MTTPRYAFLQKTGAQMSVLFGVYLAMIAVRYDLHVRGKLRDIFPAERMADELDGS